MAFTFIPFTKLSCCSNGGSGCRVRRGRRGARVRWGTFWGIGTRVCWGTVWQREARVCWGTGIRGASAICWTRRGCFGNIDNALFGCFRFALAADQHWTFTERYCWLEKWYAVDGYLSSLDKELTAIASAFYCSQSREYQQRGIEDHGFGTTLKNQANKLFTRPIYERRMILFD